MYTNRSLALGTSIALSMLAPCCGMDKYGPTLDAARYRHIDIDAKDREGNTKLDDAIGRYPHSDTEIGKLVERGATVINPANQQILAQKLRFWEMAFSGQLALVKLNYHYSPHLLNERFEAKADDDHWSRKVTYNNVTPLNAAAKGLCYMTAKQEHEKIAQFLLDKGADPEIPDNDGNFPIHYAVMRGTDHSIEFVECLLKYNRALANKPDATGSTGPPHEKIIP